MPRRSEPGPRESKTTLRETLRLRRAAVDPGAAGAAAGVVAERVLALPELATARRVFSCLSFGDELDTRGLVARLLASGREVYLPRTEPREHRLRLHRYPCPLAAHRIGLEEPTPESPELEADAIDDTIDVALVLGLAFDGDGYRLGYGAGYFDRFLARRPFPAVGLAFDFQLVDALPREPHDVPMAVVVSERRTLRPAPR